jgi:hypothetical protein
MKGTVGKSIKISIEFLPLLEKGLPVDEVLSHCCGLPSKVCTRWVALEEVGLVVRVPAADEEGDAKGTDAARLRVLLHHHGHALNEDSGRDRLQVHQLVVLEKKL